LKKPGFSRAGNETKHKTAIADLGLSQARLYSFHLYFARKMGENPSLSTALFSWRATRHIAAGLAPPLHSVLRLPFADR